MPDLADTLAGRGSAPLGAVGFAVDLSAGMAPLTFDRNGNPDGIAPQVVEDEGRPALRLAVQAGAYAGATAGMPGINDRCEIREPDKLPIAVETVHRFALKVDPAFPCVPLRCVIAQMKGNDGLSPLWALRVTSGRLYADWRLPGVTVEHHDSLPGRVGGWHDYALTFGPEEASLAVDGALVTRARADFGPVWKRRYLKLGPYRDKHHGWGRGPAAVLVRDVGRVRVDPGTHVTI